MKKAFVVLPYILAIMALVIGAFYDYQITDTLYGSMPYIALFFEKIFLIPIQFVVVFTMCLLYRDRRNKFYLLLAEVAMLYITIDSAPEALFSSTDTGTFFVALDNTTRWMLYDNVLYYLLLFIISLMVVFITNRCIRHMSVRRMHQILPFFIYMTTVLITAITITSIIKVCWGRVRYRDLENLTQYCVWYRPCGVMGNYSFPSGHVTAATALLCSLQWRKNPYEHIQIWRYLLVITLVLFMVIARLAIGAHYLSDTAMGFIITYTCYLCYTHWFKRRNYL